MERKFAFCRLPGARDFTASTHPLLVARAVKLSSCSRIEANASAQTTVVVVIPVESILAYKMVAERENDIVRNERNSALIVLASARVWASGGWRVTITTADGKEFDPAEFEKLLEQTSSKSSQAADLSTQQAQAAE
jgi:hypothetical protein